MYENCDRFEFHDVFYPVSALTKQPHVSYVEALSFGKINDFWADGKCSNVVCKVSCLEKKITIALLPTLA